MPPRRSSLPGDASGPSKAVRFLGVDLAWKDGNPSGLALLGGQKFPLHLREVPHTASSHADVRAWIARHVRFHRAAVGVDAPLLGLGDPPVRRECDDAVSRSFGRYHASTHSPSRFPHLAKFTGQLIRDFELDCFAPSWKPLAGRPAIREVYPNALQVMLFRLNRKTGLKILKYKQGRFSSKELWVKKGLRPFIDALMDVIADRWVVASGKEWTGLLARRPSPAMPVSAIKEIEDSWDALLCSLAVALEFNAIGTMRPYPDHPHDWRRGYILAPDI